jgi:hypothetical protein
MGKVVLWVLISVVVVCVVIAIIFFKVVIPELERTEGAQSRPVEVELLENNFSSRYARRVDELVHLYRSSYLTDRMAYSSLPGDSHEIPDGLSPAETMTFLRKRVTALDLHFQTVWDSNQRSMGRLPITVSKQQRVYYKSFVGDAAFLMETFAKAHNLDLHYTLKPTREQQIMGVKELQQLMRDEPDNSREGAIVKTILTSMRKAAAGLAAFDVVDLHTMETLEDINYFIETGLPVDQPYDFSKIIADLQRNRNRTAALNRKVIKNMAAYCQSKAGNSWTSTELVYPLVDAYLRAVQIALNESLPSGTAPHFAPELDDHTFARNMADQVYLHRAWEQLLRRSLGDFSLPPTLKEGLDALPAAIEAQFEVEVSVPGDVTPASLLGWIDSVREVVAAQRAEKFAKTVEAFPDAAVLADAGYTPGSPEQRIFDLLMMLEVMARVADDSASSDSVTLEQLRKAHKFLSRVDKSDSKN